MYLCAIPPLARMQPPSFLKESDVLTISSMRKLAKENAFPGREIATARSFQIFQATSTKDSAWVAPLRRILLENYKRVNNVIAE
jgi:protein MBA1